MDWPFLFQLPYNKTQGVSSLPHQLQIDFAKLVMNKKKEHIVYFFKERLRLTCNTESGQ